MTTHVNNNKRLHEEGRLLMAGAFLDQPGEPLRTMAVLTSRYDAQHYVDIDPFVQAGVIEEWNIREWGNIFR